MLDSITIQVLYIQQTGSVELKNQLKSQFLKEFEPKVLQIAQKHCAKYNRVITSSDEEFSVALRAAEEAMEDFNPEKAAKFETFASLVIARRLINYYKEEKRHQKRFVAFDKDKVVQIHDKKANAQIGREKDLAEARKEELEELNELLSDYGYTLSDVFKNKPDRDDARKRLITVGLHIVKKGLGERFLEEQRCSKELESLIGMGVRRRWLKEYRPYLVAFIITYLYNLPLMQSYLTLLGKEVRNNEPTKKRESTK